MRMKWSLSVCSYAHMLITPTALPRIIIQSGGNFPWTLGADDSVLNFHSSHHLTLCYLTRRFVTCCMCFRQSYCIFLWIYSCVSPRRGLRWAGDHILWMCSESSAPLIPFKNPLHQLPSRIPRPQILLENRAICENIAKLLPSSLARSRKNWQRLTGNIK